MTNKIRSIILLSATAALQYAASADGDFYKYTNHYPDRPEYSPTPELFKTPPPSARPQTWWHWVNGNVTREGIDADLKEMADKGYGAAIIFSLGGGKEGQIKFNSPEWFETFSYVVSKAKEYGIEIGIHNCDGWSECGGPWVGIEDSMKAMTWVLKRSDGGEIEIEQPPSKYNFYRDIAVIAYPARRPAKPEAADKIAKITPANDNSSVAPESEIPAMFDANRDTIFKISAKKRGLGYGAVLEFSEPFRAGSIYVETKMAYRFPPNIIIETSNDGKNFEKAGELKFGMSPVGSAKFKERSAKYWRLSRDDKSSNAEPNMGIIEMELIPDGSVPANASQIPQHAVKAALIEHSRTDIPPTGKFDVKKESIVKLSEVKVMATPKPDANGSIKISLPAGKWEVARLGYTTTGMRVHPCTKYGAGFEIDKMSSRAADMHFDSYIKKMLEASGAEKGKTFKYVETDSWECKQQTWTEGFEKMFEDTTGYDILKWSPVFFGVCVEGAESSDNFLSDFRRAVSVAIMKNFFGRLGERIRSESMSYELEPVTNTAICDPLNNFRLADIPQHEQWNPMRDPNAVARDGAGYVGFNGVGDEAVSAGRFYGKRLVTCESLTAYVGNWSDTPLSIKGTLERILRGGYNTVVFHSYTHQPDESVPGWQISPWGTPINRKITWWPLAKPFFKYISRVQYMNQSGRSGAKILNLYSDTIPAFKRSLYLPENVEYDIINGDGAREFLKVENGKLLSPGSMRYDMLVLTPGRFMKLETLRAVKRLVEEGAAVCGSSIGKYETLTGGDSAKAEWEKLNTELFAGGEKKIVKIGKGKIYANYSAFEACKEEGIESPALFYDAAGPVKKILSTKRLHADGSVWYWVLNASGEDKTFECSFDTAGKSVRIWNPYDGTESLAAAAVQNGSRTLVPLNLPKHSTVFVVFRNDPDAPKPFAEVKINGEKVFPIASKNAETSNFSILLEATPSRNRPITAQKPDGYLRTDNENFAVAPRGEHHARGAEYVGTGVSVGKNSIAVFEHGDHLINSVLVYNGNVPEKSKICVSYKDGTPTLYLNGRKVAEGKKSKRIPVMPNSASEKFDGTISFYKTCNRPLDAESAEKYFIEGESQKRAPNIMLSRDGRASAEFFGAGEIEAIGADGKKSVFSANGSWKSIDVKPPYKVKFQSGRGAPEQAIFKKLESWTKSGDKGIANFSGIAEYSAEFEIPEKTPGEKLVLKFDDIKDVARVLVNGVEVGTLWKPPYELDITSAAKEGKNTLAVQVANTWVNRCLYDSSLKKQDRITSSNAMQTHYPDISSGKKSTWPYPAPESGIIGKIRIESSKVAEAR